MTSPPPDGRLREEDARARLVAQTDFETPVVLEAGAGTGKTTALVARVLAWSLGPGWERGAAALREAEPDREPEIDRVAARVLSRVVAITFTEAAAAEMANRAGDALLELENGKSPIGLDDRSLPRCDVALRAHALRSALDHLVVHTIHAWCRRLLAAHPLEAGLHPDLEVDAEGRVEAEVVRDVLTAALRGAYGDGGDPRYLALAREGVEPRRIEEEVGRLLAEGVTSRALERDPFEPEAVARFADRLRDTLERFRAAAAPLREAKRARVAVETVDSVDALLARLDDVERWDRDALASLVAWLAESFPASCRARLTAWRRSRFNQTESDLLSDGDEALSSPAGELESLLDHLERFDPELAEPARHALRDLLAAVEEEMRRRGAATFTTLLTDARDLLVGRTDVAARLRARIDQLLVDEFQDTDVRQCDIVRAVALAGPRESRPGLFLVGDPKQSIYGWRSADLAAFDAFVADVRAAGGVQLRLSVNYRSAPVVLEEVERVVAPIMEESTGIQPGFQKLVPAPDRLGDPGFHEGPRAPVEYWIPAAWDAEAGIPADTRAAEATAIEAAALARDLRALHHDHGVAWRDVGVLFRSRGDLDTVLSELRAARIPFAVEGDRQYYQRREIIDASAFVRCVLDPNDHLALVAFLRSAAVGVPDAAWIPLWTRGFPGLVTALAGRDGEAVAAVRRVVDEAAEAVPDDVPGLDRAAGWEQSLHAAVAAIASLRCDLLDQPADVFVERLRGSIALEAGEAARNLGPWRLANLDRFFRQLCEDLVADGHPHDVLRRLRAHVAQEKQAEEGRPREIAENAVQILTIHGAKGLDFRHVYVMQLHRGRASGTRVLSGERRDGGGGRLEYSLFGAPTLDLDRVQAERGVVEEAERVRTLYVAMTRAKERVVLSGLWPPFQKSTAEGRTVELLQERAVTPPDLAAAMTRLGSAGAGHFLDDACARWVFPALALSDDASGPEAGPEAALPDEAALGREARELGRRKEGAEARMKRTFGGAASKPTGGEEADTTASRDDAEPPDRAPLRRDLSRAVGTAVHRALEELDLDAPWEPAIAAARAGLRASLDAALPPGEVAEAAEGAGAIFDTFAGGQTGQRLRQLAKQIVARELPVLLPPLGDDGPTAYVSGSLDLVFLDPDTDRLVVADYKTDDVPGDESIRDRARRHARQGEIYQRALREAFALPYTPRFELWFLRPDRIVAPDDAGP